MSDGASTTKAQPATPKGRRTEAAFLEAARRTFAEKGYFNTKISDIAAAAGRSPGSFYNYYDNKEQLLEALLEEFAQEVMTASTLESGSGDPYEGVRAAVTAYWHTYRKYLPEMIGLFQMSMTDERFRQRWREHRAAGIRGVLRGLHAAERSGHTIGLDLPTLASALVSLLESFCWTWLGAGGEADVAPPDDETAITTLTEIWYRTVYGAAPSA
ncbi:MULTISPECIES: TetR/AcrR family transcriptional regulator [Thermomonospora]|uniref:Transcriptional regulator, TetR family n=1 Tax=Thermomonospora curvata (strain ATCC 19995 / DSM 43183 / JCM 3096 / KCTC 9072 / NBRC 15933 / NCIMB 10081 / Henssen B9) TaxID=471852 RepID=D1A7F1_THECD|nr:MULTISPECIES: TetR/AcrR family transcriptional regulator [Thermomonospora]ACY96540.1 transcriptional regulator, TetR family [Thermomonospora curvata DSM 43183]PKK15354.1 MAG: TetR/AcrR family transcriptional regulator [Thermomonospora sp. CIF 1]